MLNYKRTGKNISENGFQSFHCLPLLFQPSAVVLPLLPDLQVGLTNEDGVDHARLRLPTRTNVIYVLARACLLRNKNQTIRDKKVESILSDKMADGVH